MKIAFDVMGTLMGQNQDKVLRLFHAFEKMGHTMYVWSNSINYAFDAVNQHKLNVPAERIMYKYTKFDAEMEQMDVMDVAVEDDKSQTYLATKKLVLVYEIPDDVEEFAKTLIKE